MRFFALGLVCLWLQGVCSPLWAAPSDWVYKIESGSDLSGQKFQGSGFVFQFQGQIYFLTSDHTIHRSYKGVSHVITKDGTRTAAKLLMDDWGRGFSLLKIESQHLEGFSDAPEWTELVGESPSTSPEQWVGYGYPASSTQLQLAFSELPGELGPSKLFYQLPQLYYAGEMIAEFGMSGGPVFTLESELLIGFMSHIAITHSAPAPEVQKPRHQLVIIPFAEIAEPIAQFLSGQGSSWSFRMPASSSSTNEVLETGPFSIISWSQGTSIKYYSPERYPPKTSTYLDHSGYLLQLQAHIAERVEKGDPTVWDWFGEFTILGYRSKGSYEIQGRIKDARALLETLDGGQYEPVGLFNVGGSAGIQRRMADIHQKLGTWIRRQEYGAQGLALLQQLNLFAEKFQPGGERPHAFVGLRPSDADLLIEEPAYRGDWEKIVAPDELKEILKTAQSFLATVSF